MRYAKNIPKKSKSVALIMRQYSCLKVKKENHLGDFKEVFSVARKNTFNVGINSTEIIPKETAPTLLGKSKTDTNMPITAKIKPTKIAWTFFSIHDAA